MSKQSGDRVWVAMIYVSAGPGTSSSLPSLIAVLLSTLSVEKTIDTGEIKWLVGSTE